MCIFLKAFVCDAWQVAIFGSSYRLVFIPFGIHTTMTIAIVYFSASECNRLFVRPYPKYKLKTSLK